MELEINGVVTIPLGMTQDEFENKLIEFIESINCTFGGGIKPFEDTEE